MVESFGFVSSNSYRKLDPHTHYERRPLHGYLKKFWQTKGGVADEQDAPWLRMPLNSPPITSLFL